MDTTIKTMHSLAKKIIISTSFLYFLAIPQASIAGVLLDKIAAIANDNIVMLSEVHKRAKLMKADGSFKHLAGNKLLKEALDMLILEKLQMQKAQQLGIVVNDTILNKTMHRLAAQNQLSLEQFQVALKKEGINYREFRETIRQRIVLSQLQKRQQQSSSAVSDEAIDDIIANQGSQLSQGTKFRYQHILFPTPPNTRLPALRAEKLKANNARQKIIRGTDFLTYPGAQKASGWQNAQQLPASTLRVINLLEKGEVSDVFHDSKGFHLIKLIDKRGSKQTVTEESHIRHILLKPKAGTTDAERQKEIIQIRQKILAGEDFANMAKQYSDDNSASRGGDLGWAALEQYVPEFSAIAKKTPVKSVSIPFKSQFGWHILQVLGKKQSSQTALNLRNQAKQLINTAQGNKSYTDWIKQLRKSATIDYKVKL